VLTPFMGVGSEVYGALINGRRGIGVELKASYFRQAASNVEAALLPGAVEGDDLIQLSAGPDDEQDRSDWPSGERPPAVPAGVRLRIPQLRDVLVSQADIIAGIETLIIAGELDAQTLRPVSRPVEPPVAEPVAPPLGTRRSGRALADALEAYAERHGLATCRLSHHLLGGRNAIKRLRRSTPQRATAERIEALLAGPPPAGLERRAAGGSRVAENGGVSGASLAAELDALIADHGLSKVRVGMHVYGNSHGVELLRRSNPRRKTVARVRALLADPPLDDLRSRATTTFGTTAAQPARAAPAGKREPDGGGVSTPAAVPAPEPDPPPQPPATGPESTWLKPAEIAWCEQCEQRVSGTKAAACTSPWCKLKGAGDDQQRQVA
jgi:hypothetical protein